MRFSVAVISMSGVAASLAACHAGFLGNPTQAEQPAPAISPEVYRDNPEVYGFNEGPLIDPKLSQAEKQKVVAQWEKDRKNFESSEDAGDGLGPVYNGTSCVACHHNVVTGNGSQVAVLRASHRDQNGNIIEPPGGSLLFQRALDPKIQVRLLPGFENHTLRIATSVLGDGLIECIEDADILAVQSKQPQDMQGTIVLTPVVVGPNGSDSYAFEERVGRFGWKAQDASLLNFAAGAYVNEMGITSPLQRIENSAMGINVDPWNPRKGVQDQTFEPESGEHVFGVDTEAFTRFMRAAKAPPPDSTPADTAAVARGKKLFFSKSLNCSVCHVQKWTTAKEGTKLGDFVVPASHASKIIEPYSDFMLHDIGTGDGIVQTQHAQRPPHSCEIKANVRESTKVPTGGKAIRVQPEMYRYYDEDQENVALRKDEVVNAPSASQKADVNRSKQRIFESTFPLSKTAMMIKTTPLWGLRSRSQLMHDGLSLTVEDAIVRHRENEAKSVFDAYSKLTKDQKSDLVAFLMTL